MLSLKSQGDPPGPVQDALTRKIPFLKSSSETSLRSNSPRSPLHASPMAGKVSPGMTLRRLFQSPQVEFAMEAHSGISAKIAAEAGFKALWASGLSMSASLCLRDRNEASWTQVADIAASMAAAAPSVPVLMDGDTGFGDFNNARRLVTRLEEAGVAGVCLEDKIFPKKNSFADGSQDLANCEEFCLKIRACKDAQKSPDFVVVARVEALIVGAGMDEALYRAGEYRKAGADAILIHSRTKDPAEIFEFLRLWNRRLPVVIVPTMYGIGVKQHEWEKAGASFCIWANHNVRASVTSMKQTSRALFESKCLLQSIQNGMVSVQEIFRLCNEDDKMKEDEEMYLPCARPSSVEDLSASASSDDDSSPRHSNAPQQERYCGPNYVPSNQVDPREFVSSLRSAGASFFTGVPDSLMKSFCAAVSGYGPLIQHVGAINEGTAVSQAAGYYFATGNVPVIYMQNSGLGNAVNPLLSMAHQAVYAVPMVIVVGWRGETMDEPQHMVQGGCMHSMIASMGFHSYILPCTSNDEASIVAHESVALSRKEKSPVFLIVRKNTFSDSNDSKALPESRAIHALDGPFGCVGMSRWDAIQTINQACPVQRYVRVCTTGKSSRELYATTCDDSAGLGLSDMLVVGSMGHASSIAQGMALGMESKGFTSRRVLCIDGDGACLMHMESLASIGQAKTSMLHVLINNGTHESVGRELTAMADPNNLDITKVAAGCGYIRCGVAVTPGDIESFVKMFEQQSEAGPWLLEVRVGISDPEKELPRPKETPAQRKEGVMAHIASSFSDHVVKTQGKPTGRSDALLMTPGPLSTQPPVRAAMCKDYGSRTPSFETIVKAVISDLAKLAPGFRVIPMQGPGTYGIESALVTFCQDESKVSFLVNGAYGERMVEIYKRLFISHENTRAIRFADTQPFLGSDAVIAELPTDATHVCMVHHETTTGLMNDLEGVLKGVKTRNPECITMVDCMSSMGGIVFDTEHVDVIVSSSNKCLEGPPGLALLWVRETVFLTQAEKLSASATKPSSLALDAIDQAIALDKTAQFRFTPPVQTLAGLHAALRLLENEGGVAARHARYAQLSTMLVEGMGSLGYKALLPPHARGPFITSFCPPETSCKFDFERFAASLRLHGFEIYPGKTKAAPCVFRVGTIGNMCPKDVTDFLAAVAACASG